MKKPGRNYETRFRACTDSVVKDHVIAELRKLRDAHAAKFNFDFDAIARDWMKEEAAARRAGQKFVDLSAKRKGRSSRCVVIRKSNRGRSKS